MIRAKPAGKEPPTPEPKARNKSIDKIKQKILNQMADEIKAIGSAIETYCYECHFLPEKCPIAKIAKKGDPNYQYDGYFWNFDIQLVAKAIIERAIDLTIKEVRKK